MQPGFLKVLDTIRSSFWFIPSIMAVRRRFSASAWSSSTYGSVRAGSRTSAGIGRTCRMARALSPGMNDPSTANACARRLGAGLCEVAHRVLPSVMRAGDHGDVPVIAVPPDLADCGGLAFGQLRRHLTCERNAARALETLGMATSGGKDLARIAALSAAAHALTQRAGKRLGKPLAALPKAFRDA